MPGVLLITYHFPPSAASGTFRLLGFVQHLPKYGYRVSVVAPPSLPWEPTDPALTARVPPGTVVYPVDYPASAPKALRWLTPYGIWAWFARRTVARAVREQRPDVVLTSGPPHVVHLLGWDLKRRSALPWVVDCRDPWITANDWEPGTGLRNAYERFWERLVFARADAIVCNAPHARDELVRALPGLGPKAHTIPNGYDPDVFLAPPPREPGPVRVLHAGQLYAGRDPAPLLDAVADVPSGTVPPFQVEFLGRTEYAKGSDLANDVKRRGLGDRVICRGQLTYKQALAEMCSADVLLLMDTPGRLIGVPAKLYEYLGAGRPVLALGESGGDLEIVLRQSGVPFRLAPPGDPGRIRQALGELVAGVASGTLPAVDDAARRRFTREALAGQLAALMDTLRGAKP